MLPDEHAINVLESLRFFARKDSNVVLNVLGGQIPRENEKFPKGELNFADLGWRGFYHCHSAIDKNPEEHGHFHLFSRYVDKQDSSADWTHVAALSIDNEGQPRAWFTVNQWVTGASWLSASDTTALLDNIPTSDAFTLTETFLLSMLGLYHEDLQKLLSERDRQLTQINAGNRMGDTLQNREVYVLSSQQINLQQRLSLAVSA